MFQTWNIIFKQFTLILIQKKKDKIEETKKKKKYLEKC